jgi:Pyruvate/2-oxoacid:ferredoxin oxidoreductase gamma subunit
VEEQKKRDLIEKNIKAIRAKIKEAEINHQQENEIMGENS